MSEAFIKELEILAEGRTRDFLNSIEGKVNFVQVTEYHRLYSSAFMSALLDLLIGNTNERQRDQFKVLFDTRLQEVVEKRRKALESSGPYPLHEELCSNT